MLAPVKEHSMNSGFFQTISSKMGRKANDKQSLWDEYLKGCHPNADLTDEEIMEEVRAVRYGKVSDNC